MEDYENRHLLWEEELYAHLKKYLNTKKPDIIAIDEVQYVIGWEKVLLSLAKYFPNTKFVVTGSNSMMLSSELTTLLRGRYMQIHMLPFWYDEYLQYFSYTPSLQTYQWYLDEGSFAYAYTLQDKREKRDWIENLINTIFLKDVIERYKIRNPELLRQLFLFVLENTGSITNMQNIKKSLKQQQIYVSTDTLQEYMQYLINSYMVYPVDIYDIQWKKVFDRMRKYYPSDHTRREILMWWFDMWWSKKLESIVYFELMRAGRKVQVWRIKKQEIDFIAHQWEEKIYVQIAYLLATPETREREYQSLQNIKNNYPKYIISLDPIPLGQKEWIQHIQAWELGKYIN